MFDSDKANEDLRKIFARDQQSRDTEIMQGYAQSMSSMYSELTERGVPPEQAAGMSLGFHLGVAKAMMEKNRKSS